MIDVLRISGSFIALIFGIVGFVWMIRQFDNPHLSHPIWCFIMPIISVTFLFGMIFLSALLGAPYGGTESTEIAKHAADKDPSLGMGLLVIFIFVALAKSKNFGKKNGNH